jgi:farnesyl-diphosphate farnesyltransferase
MTDRDQHWAWCEATLPAVSRTFALCIRYLPDDLRRTVTLSYLLCRVADTIEDAPELPAARKVELLALFADALDDPTVDLAPFEEAVSGRDDADARLTAEADVPVALLHGLPPEVAGAVSPWVREMCRGMAEFATREAGDVRAVPGALRSLGSEEDLERYCYFVAGTVGRLLTALFAVQRPGIGARRLARMEELAGDFGEGLQMVNILADVARDHCRGISYVPESVCRREGLTAAELLAPENWDEARSVLESLIERAREKLAAAREYCQLLPRSEFQLRLFCLIPYFLALRTLRALTEDPRYPEAEQRVKVGRRRVHRTLVAAQFCAASNHLLRAYSRRLDGAVWDSQSLRSA